MDELTLDGERQRGHLMAGLMASIAIMLILSTMTFQAWEEVIRRDNEAEMIFRAQEIVRAIVRYRRDQRMSPESLEILMEPGNKKQYFLRRLYEDPLVPDGKWGLLYEGPGGQIIDPSMQNLPGGGVLEQGLDFDRERNTKRDRSNTRDDRDRGRDSSLLGTPQAGDVTGMRIAGVKTKCTDTPFRIYKGFEQYSEWLFTFQDLEQPQVPGQPPAGGGGGGGGDGH